MNVALIGSGSWGTAVAGLAAARAVRVTMWAHSEQTAASINGEHRNPRYLVGYELPDNVVATTELAQALDGADAIIFAVPSTHLRDVCHRAAPFIAANTPVLCLTKGIEPESGLLMSEVIASEIGNEARVAALSGPNHAEEICRGGLSAAVIASKDPQIGETFKDLLLSTAFRIYLSQDMTGVEVCGAMKNVIAIVCGISAGTGAGDNTLALIMTRGLAEISRLVHARGGQSMTCMGLSGMGDLIATCTRSIRQPHLWLRVCPRRVARQYQTRTHMVVEGAVAARSVATRPFTGRRHSAHLCRGANALQRCYFG
ncbi:MAG: NAD(P)H-dependent glycerol-3-phosphate dehydrogenase [Collinsella aerofaciens]